MEVTRLSLRKCTPCSKLYTVIVKYPVHNPSLPGAIDMAKNLAKASGYDHVVLLSAISVGLGAWVVSLQVMP